MNFDQTQKHPEKQNLTPYTEEYPKAEEQFIATISPYLDMVFGHGWSGPLTKNKQSDPNGSFDQAAVYITKPDHWQRASIVYTRSQDNAADTTHTTTYVVTMNRGRKILSVAVGRSSDDLSLLDDLKQKTEILEAISYSIIQSTAK